MTNTNIVREWIRNERGSFDYWQDRAGSIDSRRRRSSDYGADSGARRRRSSDYGADSGAMLLAIEMRIVFNSNAIDALPNDDVFRALLVNALDDVDWLNVASLFL